METAIRALLRDPVIGLPILCAILAVVALVSGSIRAWLNQVFTWPAVSAWSKDLGTVLLITIVLFMSKLTALFIPEGSLNVFGVDLGPILSVAGPGVFFVAGATSAGTFIVSKVAAIRNALTPPDPAPIAAKAERAEALGTSIPRP